MIQTTPIRMFSTTWCPDCHRAKAFLDARGVAYDEIDIEAHPDAAKTVMAHNEGKRRVPTLEIDGAFYGNPSLARLAEILDVRDAESSEDLAANDDAAETTDAFTGLDLTDAEHRRMVIIGTGPAGLTAAIYAARADLAPLVLRGEEPGGQLVSTTEVENFPGFPEGILGPDLMERFESQAERFGAELRWGSVSAVDLNERPFKILVDSKTPILADTVVISTGAAARYLGLENERRLVGHGVSACATCDGAFHRDQKVAVVGGGDSALEEALFLTRFATEVTVIHRRDALRASKAMQERAFAEPKIHFLWNTVVEDVLGEGEVEGLALHDTSTGERSTLEIGGLFVAIGHIPRSELFQGQLEADRAGFLVTEPGTSRTNVPGVFASGDIQDPMYRQAITAAGSGAMAALDAERFLAEETREEHPATSVAVAA